jgi:type IV pilus secretin PilQ/predicted competence protein
MKRSGPLAAAVLALALRHAPAAGGEAGESAAPPRSPETFSLDVNQGKLENVLHLINKQFGLNLVAGKEVTGTVTVHLQGVTVEEALDAILRSNGFEYERKGNIVEVRAIRPPRPPEPQPPAPPPPPLTRWIPLRYATGEALKDTLKTLVPKDGGVLEYNKSRNAFLVQDSPERVARVEALLREIDRRVVQVRIEARILETIVGEHDRLGIDWATTIRLNGASRPVTFPFPQSLKGGPFFPITNKEGVLTTLVTPTASASSRNASFFDSRSGFPLSQPIDFRFGHLDATQFTAVLEALQASTETKLVANPEVTTVDGEEAKITIGSVIPIPTYTRNEERGITTLSGYEKIEVGTTLHVTPRVNDEKSITLFLEPEVSEVVGFRGPLQEFPVTETRSAKTTVVLEDGKTLVIGGLVRERTFQKTSKFPLLGDLPLIGALFRYQGEDKEKTNLLIFITPHILDPERIENEQRGMARLDGRWVPRDAAERVLRVREALESDRHEDRAAAAAALGSELPVVESEILKPAQTLDGLVLWDRSPHVRASALVALAGIDAQRTGSLLADPRLALHPDGGAALALVALGEPSRALRFLAVEAIRAGGRTEAARRFEDALLSPDPGARSRALDALSQLGLLPSRPPLVSLVRDPDPLVAIAALRAAAAHGQTAEIARAALGASDPLVRSAARHLLASVEERDAGPRSAPPLSLAIPPECPVRGEGAEALKVRQALAWLAEKAPRLGLAVRAAAVEIALVEGPTRIADGGRIELSASDAASWPLGSLAHQLVHLATHALLQRAESPGGPAVEEALAFEEQFAAVHALAGEPPAAREKLLDFVRLATLAMRLEEPVWEESR